MSTFCLAGCVAYSCPAGGLVSWLAVRLFGSLVGICVWLAGCLGVLVTGSEGEPCKSSSQWFILPLGSHSLVPSHTNSMLSSAF